MSTLVTTGSLFVQGAYPQATSWRGIGSGLAYIITNGNPSGLVYMPGSAIAYDMAGGSLYMFIGSPTDWCGLGSVAL
jgi:hypothetical protein